MAFVKYNKIVVGCNVKTTKIIGNSDGEFEIGSIVKVIAHHNYQSFDVTDNFGNTVTRVHPDALEYYCEQR